MSVHDERLALFSLLADGTHPLEIRSFAPDGRIPKDFDADPRVADELAARRIREGYEVFVGMVPRLGALGDARLQYAPSSLLWADSDTERSVTKMELFEPGPTVVVCSGGLDGFTLRQHAYWGLTQCVPADEIRRHLRRLAGFLEADMACTDPGRVLRVPGSINAKTGNVARVVRLTDDRYTLDEVVGGLPEVPEPRPRPGDRDGNNEAHMVQVGERHDALVSLLGSMRRWGVNERVLLDTAESFCKHQCETDPAVPLDIEHAKRTARDITRYPAGPACSWAMRR